MVEDPVLREAIQHAIEVLGKAPATMQNIGACVILQNWLANSTSSDSSNQKFSYVHEIPDHCDRFVYKGSYYHLDNIQRNTLSFIKPAEERKFTIMSIADFRDKHYGTSVEDGNKLLSRSFWMEDDLHVDKPIKNTYEVQHCPNWATGVIVYEPIE